MIHSFSPDAPLLLFGGVYSNLQALEALQRAAQTLGVPPDRMICAGDVVAYGADARACIDHIRAMGVHVVAGNCEQSLAADNEDCGCGYAPGGACDAMARDWYAHARAQMTDDDRAWMASLPTQMRFTYGALRCLVVHGAHDSINRFVFASTPARIKALDFEASGADVIVAGHSGAPFSQTIDGRLWHNSGALGMPANDGAPHVWFSLLRVGERGGEIVVEHHALDYNFATAAARMRAARLPEGYARALETGLWPSCDSMPAEEIKATGVALAPQRFVFRARSEETIAWPRAAVDRPLAPEKFRDPRITATGERRAQVALRALETLWLNTGTLCNLACASCYIESTPRNAALVYLTRDDARVYFDEIARDKLPTRTIGITGGEPFMNRDIVPIMDEALSRGFDVMVLTNAMKPMRRYDAVLLDLRARFGDRLVLRVSIDHYTQALHELERGPDSWRPTIDGLTWLVRNGFCVDVAGRVYSGESESITRAGYADLFAALGVDHAIDARDPVSLVLFPEMDAGADTPEITESCWGLLGKSPADMMCASSRMVVRRKGAAGPAVLACTLLAYDRQFELGETLAQAHRAVPLNHPHCARFCVLGGAACSR